MARRTRVLLAVFTSLSIGCSLVTSLGDLGGGDAGDAGFTDVSTQQDADASNGNLVSNPSFDDGQGGCGLGWGNGYGMTFTRVSPGRTGPYACEVCVQGTPSGDELHSIGAIPVQAGSYYAEAYVTTPDGGTPDEAGTGILVYYAIDAGITGCLSANDICQGSFSQVPTGSWQRTNASFIANGAGTVTVGIHTYRGTPGSCVIVDDVALYAQ